MIPLLGVVFVLAVLFGAPAALGAGAGLVVGYFSGRVWEAYSHTRAMRRARFARIFGGH